MTTQKIRIALPGKGILEQKTQAFLKECGLTVLRTNDRQYFGLINRLTEAEVIFQRVGDIPALVNDGIATLGITGHDVLAEYQANSTSEKHSPLLIRPLGYGECRLVIAVPGAWDEVMTLADLRKRAASLPHMLRIATKYPNLTQKFWDEHDLPICKIELLHGAIEAAPRLGIADLIVDLTATGTTLRVNDLKELELTDGLLLNSQACLIGHTESLQHHPDAQTITTQVLELIDARLQTQNYTQLTAFLPLPTVPLTEETRLALEATITTCRFHVVSRFNSDQVEGYMICGMANTGEDINEQLRIVSLLRDIGATDITFTPMTHRFERSSVSTRLLRERLQMIMPQKLSALT